MRQPADQPPGRLRGRLRDRLSSRLVDPRLAARVTAARRSLTVAVLVGAGSAACVVIQAVLLADILSRTLLGTGGHSAVSLADLRPQLIGLGAAFVARALLATVGEATAQHAAASVTAILRRQFLHHVLELGPGWLAGQRTGELTLTATRGTESLEAYFGRYVPSAVLAALVPAGLLAWVAYEDWVSLLILLGMVALVPLTMIHFGRQATERAARQWRGLSSLSARFLQLIQGLPTLRAFGRAAQGRREVREATEGLRRATMSTLRVAFLSALAMELISGLGVGLVAMVLGLRLLSGSLPLAVALAVLLVSPEVFLPLRRAGAEFHASAEGQAAASRILGILDLPVPIGEEAIIGTGTGEANTGPAIEVRRLTVRYPDRDQPALDRFDLTVAPGEHVAVTGPSGSGKSTLLAALLGFARPESGSVRVGATGGEAARRLISWVPQRPHLVTGSIADNLRIGGPEAGDEALWAALEAVDLGRTMRQLPAGLATMLGEDGLSLSAGERQRLGLARAMLRDAPIVLLDEPAGHLNPELHDLLQRSLDPWLDARTVVVAAHRPELVTRIDRVISL